MFRGGSVVRWRGVVTGDDPWCGWGLGGLFEADAAEVREEVFQGFGVAADAVALGGDVLGDEAAVVVAVLHIDPVAEGLVQMPEPTLGVQVLTGGETAAGGALAVVLGDVVEVAAER